MPDYNIYIKNETEENQSQTKPKKPGSSGGKRKKTEPKSNNKALREILSVAQNPDSLVSKGVSAIASGVPAVAVAIAVLKITDKVVSFATQIETARSGDYRFNTYYNNFKSATNLVFSPVSSTANYIKAKQQIDLENQKRRLNRELLGDSLINNYSSGV